jgi:polar amino acid transport system substrate-binding protein
MNTFIDLHKQMFFCLIAIGVFHTATVLAENPTMTLSSECTSLTASGNSEYPPFLWRQTHSSVQLQGINRLIIDEVSRRIDIPIELIHVGAWSQVQTELKNGHVDLIAGAFYTNERAHYMDYFTPVMLHTNSVAWQQKNKPFSFTRKEDLEGKWGVTVINNSLGQAFDEYARRRLNVLTVASLSQALQMLAEDQVDYMLYEKNPANAYATMLNLSDVIAPVEPYLSSEGLYLTISKQSLCNTGSIKHRITMALQQMKAEGFMDKALLEGIKMWGSEEGIGQTVE